MIRSRFDIDLRLVIAASAALVAGLAVLTLTRPPATVEVVVAGEHLPPGVPLGSLPLATAELSNAAGVLPAGGLEAAAHLVLAAPLAPGDPILESLLVEPQPGRHRVIGLTLRSEQAVHGDLVAGDRVAVYATRDDLPPRRVGDSVLVLAARPGPGGFGTSDIALLLAVDDRLAAEVIRTMYESSLHLVKVGR